jgi:hypothetical protein
MSIPFRLIPVLAILFGIHASTSALAQQAQQDADADLMRYFYKDPRPSRLLGFVERYQNKPAAQRPEAYVPLVGFLAAVCRSHPGEFESLTPTDPNPRTAAAVSAAVRLCANDAIASKLRPRLEPLQADKQLQAILAGLPPGLDDLRVSSPTHLDILWGASFAGGDTRYVAVIADFFAQIANQSDAVALDIAQTVLEMAGGPKGTVGQLRSKYGDDGARRLIYAASALWALQSNARQHAFVDQFLVKYIAEHPGTPATKALVAMRPRNNKT